MEPARQRTAARASRPEERLAQRGGLIELLRVPALLFGGAVRLRRAAYDHGIAPCARVPVPVVSVGNLTTGGTGKTPACVWVVRALQRRGFEPGLLSRGYGAARTGELNDEGRLLERLCPSVPHIQDAERARGAHELVRRGVDAIVLDDGFQHRQLARDLDLVLVDASRPWGFAPADEGAPVRALLPRGLLREPPSSLRRAHAVVLTRTDAVELRALEKLEGEIRELAPGRAIARTTHRARAWRDEKGAETPLVTLSGREVDLVSALGNPAAFEASVRESGVRVREHRVFPDHHDYRREDVLALGDSGRTLVTSAKDAVKLGPLGVRFQSLEIELSFASGESLIEALLDALPRSVAARRPSAIHEGIHG